MVQRVNSISQTYTSDLPAPTAHSGGILRGTHPVKRPIFAWVADAVSLELATAHLTSQGYDPDSFAFLPYSSKDNWTHSHPEITLSLEASDGALHSCTAANTAHRPKKKKKRKRKSINNNAVGIETHPSSILSNAQRDYLHIEIYKYFASLQSMLSCLEEERSRMGKVCSSSEQVGKVLFVLAETFKVVECNAVVSNESNDDNDACCSDVGESMLENMRDELEERLEGKTLRGQSHSREAGLTFEEYYEKLVAFKEEYGHVNVPNRYKDKNLANWVHDVRRNKKDMQNELSRETKQPSTSKRKKSQYVRPSALTPHRISLLESLSFNWNVRNVPAHVSWDDRFEQLMEYYNQHGSWPPHSLGALGSWVKHQRRRWAVNDAVFMNKCFPRLEEVGFVWRVKAGRKPEAQMTIEHSFEEQDMSNEQYENVEQYDVEVIVRGKAPAHHEDEMGREAYDDMVAGEDHVKEQQLGQGVTDL